MNFQTRNFFGLSSERVITENSADVVQEQISNKINPRENSFQHPEYLLDLSQIACKAFNGSMAGFSITNNAQPLLPVWFSEYANDFSESVSLLLELTTNAQSVCVPNVKRLPNNVKNKVIQACGIRAYICIPITLESGCSNCTFFITFAQPQKFDANSFSLIKTFVNLASLQIKKNLPRNDSKKTHLYSEALQCKIEEQKIALKRNDQRLKQVSHLAKIGQWEFCLLDQTILWSDQVYDIHEVIRGTPIEVSDALNYYRPEDRMAVTNFMRNTLETGEPYEFELSIITALGNHRIVRSMGEAEVKDSKIVRLFGIFKDVTQQRFMESQAQQLQKMETFGELTAGIAHDFNNLLSCVIGNLEIHLRRPDCISSESKEVEDALASARRGATLISQLLSFARVRKLASVAFQPESILAELDSLLREACGSSFKLVVDIIDHDWYVFSDVSQFETAILNLVINARDAYSAFGEIRITVENIGIVGSQELTNLNIIPKQYVSISVSDEGMGIPKSIINNVTEPFFTTKKNGKGTGLGLSLVESIVKSSGGFLEIDTAEGVGTTVRMLLPRFAYAGAC